MEREQHCVLPRNFHFAKIPAPSRSSSICACRNEMSERHEKSNANWNNDRFYFISSFESVWLWITAKNLNTCCSLPVTKLKIKRKLRTKKHMHTCTQSIYFVVRWVEGTDKTRIFPLTSFFSVVSFLPLCMLLSFARSCCSKQNCLMKIYAVKKFQRVLFFSIRFDVFFLWILSPYSLLRITEFFNGKIWIVVWSRVHFHDCIILSPARLQDYIDSFMRVAFFAVHSMTLPVQRL